MLLYRIEFTASAAKEFRSLPEEIKTRIRAAVDSLAVDPRPSGVRKLQGHNNLYRIRVGHYRVVYYLDDPMRLVKITRLRHQREVYR